MVIPGGSAALQREAAKKLFNQTSFRIMLNVYTVLFLPAIHSSPVNMLLVHSLEQELSEPSGS